MIVNLTKPITLVEAHTKNTILLKPDECFQVDIFTTSELRALKRWCVTYVDSNMQDHFVIVEDFENFPIVLEVRE